MMIKFFAIGLIAWLVRLARALTMTENIQRKGILKEEIKCTLTSRILPTHYITIHSERSQPALQPTR